MGGSGGAKPPQESPLPVPCPRALPPIYAYDLRVRFTRTIYEFTRTKLGNYYDRKLLRSAIILISVAVWRYMAKPSETELAAQLKKRQSRQ